MLLPVHALHKSFHKDFWHFETSVWLHTIAVSLVSIFVPILLLELGYSLTEVVGYYLVMYAIDIPLNFLAEKMVARIGAKRTIVIATFAAIAWFLILGAADIGAGWKILLSLALLDAIYDACYYVGHVYLFLRASKTHTGKETGLLYSARTLGAMCGPLVGAFLFVLGAREFLLGTSILFFLLSLVPLGWLRHAEDRPRGPRTTLALIAKSPVDRRNFLSLFLNAVHVAGENMLWPIFVYVALGGGNSVAMIAVFIALSKILFAYVAGSIRRTDRVLALSVGGILIGATWLARSVFPEESFAYASVIFLGFVGLLTGVPIDTAIFERGRRSDSLRYATLRNTVSMSGQIVLFIALLGLTNLFPESFVTPALAGFLLTLLAATGATRGRVSSA